MAKEIDRSERVPYFIDRLFDLLSRQIGTISIELIDQAWAQIIQDPEDINNLKHSYDRINEHYPHPFLSEQILTIICHTDTIPEDDIIEKVLQTNDFDIHVIKEEIDRLWRDA